MPHLQPADAGELRERGPGASEEGVARPPALKKPLFLWVAELYLGFLGLAFLVITMLSLVEAATFPPEVAILGSLVGLVLVAVHVGPMLWLVRRAPGAIWVARLAHAMGVAACVGSTVLVGWGLARMDETIPINSYGGFMFALMGGAAMVVLLVVALPSLGFTAYMVFSRRAAAWYRREES